MQWGALAVAALLYMVSAYLTFSDKYRNAPYFLPACLGIGVLTASIWFGMVKYLDDKQKIYFFSLCWDTMMVMVFYFLPLFLGVKLDKWSLFGIGLMLVGLSIVKLRIA